MCLCTFIDKRRTSRQLALLRCEPQLSCSVGPKRESNCHRVQTCSCGRANSSCLRWKHAACDTRSCSRCTSHKVKNWSVDECATGFTKSAKWQDCDSAALLLWHSQTITMLQSSCSPVRMQAKHYSQGTFTNMLSGGS